MLRGKALTDERVASKRQLLPPIHFGALEIPAVALLPAQAGDSMVLDVSVHYLVRASVVARSWCVLSCGGPVPGHSDAHWSHPS
jgi:hypothetical protein